METPSRLKMLRNSHCDGCGCARCKRIDGILADTGETASGHPGSDDGWLVEGRLVRSGSQWFIEQDGTRTPLDDLLAPWADHEVTVLVGMARED